MQHGIHSGGDANLLVVRGCLPGRAQHGDRFRSAQRRQLQGRLAPKGEPGRTRKRFLWPHGQVPPGWGEEPPCLSPAVWSESRLPDEGTAWCTVSGSLLLLGR